MTMEERSKRGKSWFMTQEEKLAYLQRETGQLRRREVTEEPLRPEGRARARRRITALGKLPDKKPPRGGWVPPTRGKLGTPAVNEMWEAGYREASREALFTGWEKVGKTLGKVKGGTMYE